MVTRSLCRGHSTLKDTADSFPPEFTSHKVLPALVAALDVGGASASSILPLVLQLGVSVPPSEQAQLVIAPIVKLFASPDRGTRMALLDHLPEFVDKLDQRTVTDKLWPHLVCTSQVCNSTVFESISLQQTGFGDTVAVIRETTVRSIGLLSSKVCSPRCDRPC